MLKKIEKPWGFEVIWSQTQNYVGKILFIRHGQRLSLQYHEVKEETIYVLEGELEIIIGEYQNLLVTKRILPGESVHIPPGMIHRFCAPEGDVKLVEVSTTELNDVVRIDDDYKRV